VKLIEPVINAFLIILIGYLARKFIKFDEKTIASILLYITGPALAFVSLYKQEFVLSELVNISIISIVIVLISAVIMKAILVLLKERENGMVLPAAFMNSGYLGYPVSLFAFGELGLMKAIIFDSVETIVHFTLGVFIVQKASSRKREKLKEVFKLPFIYVIPLAVILNYLAFPIPAGITTPLDLLGKATIPLALIALGARLTSIKVNLHILKTPIAALFVRFILGFAIAYALVSVIPLSDLSRKVILLLAVMPPAVNSYVLNEKYNNRPEEAATAVLLGTLISIIPIALVLNF